MIVVYSRAIQFGEKGGGSLWAHKGSIARAPRAWFGFTSDETMWLGVRLYGASR